MVLQRLPLSLLIQRFLESVHEHGHSTERVNEHSEDTHQEILSDYERAAEGDEHIQVPRPFRL